MIWIAEDSVRISNNIYSSKKDSYGKHELYLQPKSANLVDNEQVVKDFWYTTMWLADSLADIYDSSRTISLKHTYIVGQELKVGSRQPANLSQSKTPNENAPTPTVPEADLSLDWAETSVSLEDIGGLEDIKQTLKEIAVSFAHSEIMAKWGAERPQGVLLYGEPGTGKTMLAEALANEMGAKLWQVKSTDIYDKWHGDSEKNMQAIFTRARSVQERTILLFDELDSIIGIAEEPTSGGDIARNAVAGIFKQELNTLAHDNPNILVVATSNRPDKIDDALIRSGRFDYKIYVPMPDGAARRDIMLNVIAHSIMAHEQEGFQVFSEDINLDDLSRATDGFSGADIAEVFRRLQFGKAMQEAQTGAASPINHSDLIEAIRKFRTKG